MPSCTRMQYTEVLHDDRIRLGGLEFFEEFQERADFILIDQRIQGEVDLAMVAVGKGDEIADILQRKILGPFAGIEILCAEIECVGAGIKSCLKA